MRALRDSHLTLTSPTFVGADGETPTDCASSPTVALSTLSGVTLSAPTVTNTDTGIYTAALTPTHTADLDTITATWTGTADSMTQVYAQTVEVVGAHYATIPEIRSQRGLEDTRKYPLSMIVEKRDKWSDRCDSAAVSFVPRFTVERLAGNGRDALLLRSLNPTALRSVTIDDEEQDITEFSIESGVLRWSQCFPSSTTPLNVTVGYEHGFASCPSDIRDPWLNAVRGDLLSVYTDLPNNAISSTYEGGVVIRYSTPDPRAGRPTGIVHLDAALASYSIPAVA